MTNLSHEKIINPTTPPKAWMLFVHGFLGTKANWRTFARKVVTEKPHWGAVLVDLRMHGASQNLLPPHSIAAAAQDLVDLSNVLDEPVRAVLGHSFGAKVVLQYVEYFHQALDVAWLVDFIPWAITDKNIVGSYKILNVLESLVGQKFAARMDFENILTQKGINKAMAQWLAMNLVVSDDGYVLSIQPSILRTLLDDYCMVDLMHVLENAHQLRTHIHYALGGKSESVSGANKQRILQLDALSDDNVTVHVFEDAGHYVHLDAFKELSERVIQSLA